MKSWINCHQHTLYSFLDGHARLPALMDRAKELGMDAVAQTDHGNIHGWVDFYEAATAAEIKPILGLEAYQARKTRFDRDEEERAGKAADNLDQRGPYHLTLLARNLTGYHNLIKLSSRSFAEGFYVKPRIDHELLAEHAEGLTILSGCLGGQVQQQLLRGNVQGAYDAAAAMQAMVGRDHFYIEIQDHGLVEQAQVKDELLTIARKLQAPIVPTGDCHYVMQSDAHAHDVLLCVATNATFAQENRFKFFNDEFYLKSYDEMATRFPEEYLATTLRVSDQVELDLSFDELYFPEYPDVPANRSVDDYLEELVWHGLRDRYGATLPDDVRDRAEYELRVVSRMGFQHYFLVVWDLVAWAKRNNIRVGWGRGSAAGSILSYALGITNLDPLRFGLLFERFLVEGRKSMPDIDLDFDDRYRDRVIAYARDRYGSDRVAHICNFSGMKARAAVKDAARVLGYEFTMANTINKAMPAPVLGITKTIDEALEVPEFRKVYDAAPAHQEIIDSARGLEGLFRQPGMHAAGIVISPAPTQNFVPTMQRPTKDGSPGVMVTQWEMEAVEKAGQLKIDFLGLRNLGIIDALGVDVDTIPLDDAATYAMLCRGETLGVFQLESEGMRQVVLQVQPASIEDIMGILTIYRPGPMGSGQDQKYIARRHGRERVEHTPVSDILAGTYGLMLYQEDVLAVARELAGFSAAEADDLRKVIGKKIVHKIGLFRAKFVEGCVATNDVDPVVAHRIFSDIEYFGGYAFNRAHAASYAMVSYVTAYLKCHHPGDYMAAVLTSVAAKRDRLPRYLNEMRRLGFEIRPPAVDRARPEFYVESPGEVRFGLSAILGLGETSLPLMRAQSYRTWYDYFRRCDPGLLNMNTIEALARAGCLDELVPEQPGRPLRRADKLELLAAEHDALGTYITEHPLQGVWHVLETLVTHMVVDLDELPAATVVAVGGLVRGLRKSQTKKGQTMWRFYLADISAEIEVIVFPFAVRALPPLHDGDIVVVKGKVNHDGDEEHYTSNLVFQAATIPSLPVVATSEPLILDFSGDPSILEKVEAIIDAYPGDSPVLLRVQAGPHRLTYTLPKPTSADARAELEAVLDTNAEL